MDSRHAAPNIRGPRPWSYLNIWDISSRHYTIYLTLNIVKQTQRHSILIQKCHGIGYDIYFNGRIFYSELNNMDIITFNINCIIYFNGRVFYLKLTSMWPIGDSL